MKTEFFCVRCQKKLDCDDRGIYRKLISRTSEDYICIPCLAKHFKVDETSLRKKAEILKNLNCALFY